MASIDIRTMQGERITRINFAEGDDDETNAVALEIDRFDVAGGQVGIISRAEDVYVPATLATKTDAENMIAALKKAIELGWLK